MTDGEINEIALMLLLSEVNNQRRAPLRFDTIDVFLRKVYPQQLGGHGPSHDVRSKNRGEN